MKHSDRFPRLRLPLWATLLAAVALAGCITLLALWCQPNALRTIVANFRRQPLLIVLNCLPIGLLLLAFTCLLRNLFFAGALVNFAVCALSIANRIKLEVRDEPVFPRDFALLKEVGSAMGTYDIHFPVKVIAVVVAGKKKKTAPAAGKAEKQEETKKAAPVLRSMAPQHGGMVVQLHRQPVQIGRDSAVCRLVYQDGTPGVSSKHCQIYFDEGEGVFVVTDLNSTYGTFQAGGQRIAPNVPTRLSPKSSIYLGEPENTICLDVE